jgi:hypothetical protein
MNNTIILDHKGLFIFIDFSYPGSYHDVNILAFIKNGGNVSLMTMNTLISYLGISGIWENKCS